MPSQKIVAAVDAGERSMDPVRLGGDLALALGAPLALFTAFPHTPLMETAEPEMREIREEARAILLEMAQALEGVEVDDAQVVPSNSPARELQRLSEQDDVGLVVVASTHRGRVGRVVPGSVGERLLSGAACPVAIAPRGYSDRERQGLRRVGVAYDGSEEAQRALAAAIWLAARAGAELQLFSVQEPLAFGLQPAEFSVSPESLNQRLEAELRTALAEAVDQARAQVPAEGEFAVGDAAGLLAERSAELDLLVSGSRGYGPIGAVLLGGMTHRLVGSAACPLLVLPRGTELAFAGA